MRLQSEISARSKEPTTRKPLGPEILRLLPYVLAAVVFAYERLAERAEQRAKDSLQSK